MSTIALNKPTEVVAAMADPEGRKTLRNSLRGFPSRVYPVGNLEYAASGLILLTNDGDFARRNPQKLGASRTGLPHQR